MTARVAGCVHSLQTNTRLAFEGDDVAVFDEAIDVNIGQRFSRLWVSRDGNIAAEMIFQRVHAADMIRMWMRGDDFPHPPAFRDHFVETLGQDLLLIFVR